MILLLGMGRSWGGLANIRYLHYLSIPTLGHFTIKFKTWLPALITSHYLFQLRCISWYPQTIREPIQNHEGDPAIASISSHWVSAVFILLRNAGEWNGWKSSLSLQWTCNIPSRRGVVHVMLLVYSCDRKLNTLDKPHGCRFSSVDLTQDFPFSCFTCQGLAKKSAQAI